MRSRLRAVIGAVALAGALTGCAVTTSVAVQVQPGGGGAVTVDVDLDRAAVTAVGGVQGALHVSDLEAAGWRVTSGPAPGGGTVITLTQSFAHLSQLPGLLAEVGRAPGGSPLFALQVTQGVTFFTSRTTVAGRVDLTCGLSCFGDAGLQRVYGSTLGVDPPALRTAAGQAAVERDLTFEFSLRVPGRVTASNAASDAGGTLRWAPALGQMTALAVTTTGVVPRHVHEAAAAGGLTVVGLVVVILAVVVSLRRGRRGRRGHRRRRSPPVPSSGNAAPPDRPPLP